MGSREALSLGMETELPNSLPGDDQDECLLLPGELCQHLCINTVGSYHCACFPGFSLQDDGRTCRSGKHLDSPEPGPGLILPGIVACQGTTGYFSRHPTHRSLQDAGVSGGGLCEARQIGSFPELSAGDTQRPALGLGAELRPKPHRLPSTSSVSPVWGPWWLSPNR